MLIPLSLRHMIWVNKFGIWPKNPMEWLPKDFSGLFSFEIVNLIKVGLEILMHYLIYSVLAEWAGSVYSLSFSVIGFYFWMMFAHYRLEYAHLQHRSPDENKQDVLESLYHLVGSSKKENDEWFTYASAQWRSFLNHIQLRIRYSI